MSFAGDAASDATLVAALRGAGMTLLDGVRQAAAGGTPISARFDIEQGKLSLSVYTAAKGLAIAPESNVLQEVSGSPRDGEWEPEIEVFQDAAHIARSSGHLRIMSMAHESLADAIVRAQKTHGGTVFSATPVMNDRKPVIEMLVVDKGKVRTVLHPL